MKKVYVTPKVNTEKVVLGVFGSYGTCGSLKESVKPFKFFHRPFKGHGHH